MHETFSTAHHVNPSWCITLVELLVGTEPCLRKNKAIYKKICSCVGLVERRYIVNGHPMVKQGWAHGDNVRAHSMVMIKGCGWGR